MGLKGRWRMLERGCDWHMHSKRAEREQFILWNLLQRGSRTEYPVISPYKTSSFSFFQLLSKKSSVCARARAYST